jgi:serine/threonine-protein kinase
MSQPEEPLSTSVDETPSWDSTRVIPVERDLTGVTLGDFEVERRLGRGGMGEVYLARQISLNRPVALKVLRPDLVAKPTYLSRFEAEATAVAKLNNPNIVHIYMLGSVEQIRFIAMEYVQGTNLRDYMLKKGRLELPLALSIMKQAGQAIGAAGERGLVHRDIKPENILLTRKGQVKVADFGLCRDLDANRLHLTQPGVTMGTPLYMSPEQAQGYPLDHRSDLYSLGVTFYHMLAGSPPFRAESALALALKHVQDMPVHLAVHRPDLPSELCVLVMKLMAKDPRERYQSAAEMLHDLSKLKEALQTSSSPLPRPELTATSITANGNASTTTQAEKFSASLQPKLRWITRGMELGLSRRVLAVLIAFCFAAGLLRGWLARPVDLLAASAAEVPKVPPALWMVPAWQKSPRQATGEAQYHYAQTAVAREDEVPAWLSVPGYFPADRNWAFKAYVQLARSLFRRHDSEMLSALATEIDGWDPKHAREREKDLAIFIQAAVEAIEEHPDNVIKEIDRVNASALVDPALLELGIEITQQAINFVRRSGDSHPALKELQARERKLLLKLLPDNFRQQLGQPGPG